MNGKDELNTFFLAFVGQPITITTDVMVTSIAGADHEGFPVTETIPLMHEGVLLDFDEEYYYLGPENDPNQITQAVPKSAVKHIVVLNDEDIYSKLLEDFPNPDKKEEIN